MKKSLTLSALKPRNVFARLATRRRAGAHRPAEDKRQQQRKDLLQRLREAGL